MVREATAVVIIEKYGFNLTFSFFSLRLSTHFLLLLLFCNSKGGERTIIDQYKMHQYYDTAVRCNSSISSSNNNNNNKKHVRTIPLVVARVTETERFIERSKEYYYQPRVIAIYAHIMALTRY